MLYITGDTHNTIDMHNASAKNMRRYCGLQNVEYSDITTLIILGDFGLPWFECDVDGVPVQNQDLENIISTRRNPVIADLMNRMDFMERRGSGFRKILAAVKFAPNYREENLPVFKSTPFSFTAIVKNMNFLDKEGQKIENVPLNVPLSVPLNERQKMILEYIKNGESYTAVQFAQKLGVSDKTIKRDFQFLSDSGLIKHIGSDKSGKWMSVKQ